MDWDLSTRERWAAARAKGCARWVLRGLVSPLLAAFGAFACLLPTEIGQEWWEALLVMLTLAVLGTAYLLRTVYVAAEGKFSDSE